MEIILVRHGQPAWVAPDGRGVDDPALTDLGHRQARRVADAARAWEADEVWVSPATRARQTAAPVIEALGLEPAMRPWLREIEVPGRDQLQAAELDVLLRTHRKRSLEQWWEPFPGGHESLRDFIARVTGGLDDTLGARGAAPRAEAGLWDGVPRDGRVVIVSHAGTGGVLLAHLLGLDHVPWPWERFATPHASVTRIRSVAMADGVIFSLRLYGDVSIHPAGERTR